MKQIGLVLVLVLLAALVLVVNLALPAKKSPIAIVR